MDAMGAECPQISLNSGAATGVRTSDSECGGGCHPVTLATDERVAAGYA